MINKNIIMIRNVAKFESDALCDLDTFVLYFYRICSVNLILSFQTEIKKKSINALMKM